MMLLLGGFAKQRVAQLLLEVMLLLHLRGLLVIGGVTVGTNYD